MAGKAKNKEGSKQANPLRGLVRPNYQKGADGSYYNTQTESTRKVSLGADFDPNSRFARSYADYRGATKKKSNNSNQPPSALDQLAPLPKQPDGAKPLSFTDYVSQRQQALRQTLGIGDTPKAYDIMDLNKAPVTGDKLANPLNATISAGIQGEQRKQRLQDFMNYKGGV